MRRIAPLVGAIWEPGHPPTPHVRVGEAGRIAMRPYDAPGSKPPLISQPPWFPPSVHGTTRHARPPALSVLSRHTHMRTPFDPVRYRILVVRPFVNDGFQLTGTQKVGKRHAS